MRKQPGRRWRRRGALYLSDGGIQKKREELALSVEKMKLELDQSAVRSKQIPGISEETLAVQSLEAAKRALDFGYQDLEEIKRDSEEKLADLKRDYNQSMTRSEEEMEEETRRQYRTAERAYDAAVARKESAVRKAERRWPTARRSWPAWKRRAPQTKRQRKPKKALDRANEDLEEVREEQSLNVAEAKEALNSAEEDYGDVSAGRRTAAEALKSSYEASVQAVEAQIKAGEKAVRDLEGSTQPGGTGGNQCAGQGRGDSGGKWEGADSASLDRQGKQLDITKAETQLKNWKHWKQPAAVTAPWQVW